MKNILLSVLMIVACSNSFAQTPSAKTILAEAYKQAQVNNKNVLVIFHASWCGWCHKMDSSINNVVCKKYFNDNYIITHLTVHESDNKKHLENEGADEILRRYHAFNAGIPFWLIYDKNGNLLASSITKDTEGRESNIGCPASEKEVTAFTTILKKTSSLNDAALAVIAAVFRKNEN